jgi:Rha family phage regulatory protein
MNELTVFGVKEIKGKLFVSSRDVARIFEKEHFIVLRDIRELNVSEEFGKYNFVLTNYKDEHNRKQPEYLLTKDGFAFLCMGYTGEKANSFKEAYIRRFNEMERIITEKLMERYAGKSVRKALTETIQERNLNPVYHGHAYSLFTDLVYRYALGTTCKKLKEQLGLLGEENLRDYLTAEQLGKVKRIEKLVENYVELGFTYEQVKESIERNIETIKKIKS